MWKYLSRRSRVFSNVRLTAHLCNSVWRSLLAFDTISVYVRRSTRNRTISTVFTYHPPPPPGPLRTCLPSYKALIGDSQTNMPATAGLNAAIYKGTRTPASPRTGCSSSSTGPARQRSSFSRPMAGCAGNYRFFEMEKKPRRLQAAESLGDGPPVRRGRGYHRDQRDCRRLPKLRLSPPVMDTLGGIAVGTLCLIC
ncbi:hypothetical protein BDDG_04314 [Blastomyces dermatitidis ATCC 18188]|uniref:Uncharacterized protein n=1 Tax=Ajellomyces dermatitidis (strain ATCC 18188 / CBS 674.68) TaxID=653446 RepID=F2TDQ9_AJEDA|nr:hypothetical protein BDDG_04314 [Blastomyces dermatitidis ATCC 18188]